MAAVPGPAVVVAAAAVMGQRGVGVEGMKTYIWFIKDGCGSRLDHRPDWLASVPGPEENSGAIMSGRAWHATPRTRGINGMLGSWGPGLSSVCLGSSVMLQALR